MRQSKMEIEIKDDPDGWMGCEVVLAIYSSAKIFRNVTEDCAG